MLRNDHLRWAITSIAAAMLLAAWVQPSLGGTTVISFEQGEEFPVPGGSLDGLTTNGGLATWSGNNLESLAADSGPDDGFGFGGGSPDPNPLTGSQIAVASGVAGEIAQVILELSTPMALDSFFYANRGGYPPRLEVEYYDAGGQSIGTNAYMAPYDINDTQTDLGSFPTIPPFTKCVETVGGLTGCGVGLDNDFNPKFHQISPTEPFEGVGLSKVIFSSYQNPERYGGALNVGPNHGSFQLEDITLSDPTTTFNPNDYLRISFEASEGFPDSGGRPTDPGAPTESDGGILLAAYGWPQFPQVEILTTGAGIPGIIDNFSIADNNQMGTLVIDHGPGCGYADGQEGACIPNASPDPVHGTQMVVTTSVGEKGGTDDDFTVEIDLNNAAALAPVSFWYAYRGNGGTQSVDIEYFDMAGDSLGIESWTGSPDGGATLGTDSNWHPQFDKIIIGEGTKTALPTAKGVALSKMIINSTHNIPDNDCDGLPGPPILACAATFAMDDLLFECTTGNCPDYPVTPGTLPGDFNNDDQLDNLDIDILAAAVRNGTSDPEFNVDGIGGNVPDEADFDFYITSDSFLGTGFGDHDLNMTVNFNDFVLLSNNFGKSGAGWNQGNANTDDFTNFNDFVRLSNNFGKSFASDNVPEPASLIIATIGILVAVRGRKRDNNLD